MCQKCNKILTLGEQHSKNECNNLVIEDLTYRLTQKEVKNNHESDEVAVRPNIIFF